VVRVEVEVVWLSVGTGHVTPQSSSGETKRSLEEIPPRLGRGSVWFLPFPVGDGMGWPQESSFHHTPPPRPLRSNVSALCVPCHYISAPTLPPPPPPPPRPPFIAGAGHDLRGATQYLGTRIRGLRYALQCLIDYKGFRMTAQVSHHRCVVHTSATPRLPA